MVSHIIFLASLAFFSSYSLAMHDVYEDRLLESDEKQIQFLKDHIHALKCHIDNLNDELDKRDFDIMLLRDAARFTKALKVKQQRTVSTQTDIGPFLLRRCQRSPDLRLEDK